MNILSLFSFGSRDQIFNLQISINGLVLWFQGFHSIHHLPLQAEDSPDNYSWLHRRFIGEHGKPTLGGCGWRQGSLTLSFMIGHMTMIVMFLLVMWARVIIHYSFIKWTIPNMGTNIWYTNFGVLFWCYVPKNVSGDWEHVSCCCDNQILLTYKHFNRIQSPQHGKRWEHQYRYICCICTQASLVCIQIGLPWPSTFIFIHWRTPSRLLVTTTVCLHINQLGILVNDFLSALQS